jgi:hypothetical protein
MFNLPELERTQMLCDPFLTEEELLCILPQPVVPSLPDEDEEDGFDPVLEDDDPVSAYLFR